MSPVKPAFSHFRSLQSGARLFPLAGKCNNAIASAGNDHASSQRAGMDDLHVQLERPRRRSSRSRSALGRDPGNDAADHQIAVSGGWRDGVRLPAERVLPMIAEVTYSVGDSFRAGWWLRG